MSRFPGLKVVSPDESSVAEIAEVLATDSHRRVALANHAFDRADVVESALKRLRSQPTDLAMDIIGLKLAYRADARRLPAPQRQALAIVALSAMETAAAFRDVTHPSGAEMDRDVLANLPHLNVHDRSRSAALALNLEVNILVARELLDDAVELVPQQKVGSYEVLEQRMESAAEGGRVSADVTYVRNLFLSRLAEVSRYKEPLSTHPAGAAYESLAGPLSTASSGQSVAQAAVSALAAMPTPTPVSAAMAPAAPAAMQSTHAALRGVSRSFGKWWLAG